MRCTILAVAVVVAATVSTAVAREKTDRVIADRIDDRIVQLCHDTDDCQDGFYCATPLGRCDGSGFCAPLLPDEIQCLDIWEPVCGCDGRTYSNGCYARQAGVSVDYVGECDNNYCWSNAECARDEYCFFDECAAETGICLDRPEICLDVWDPVCGCDHQTYSNGCYAARAGVSVDYEGECRPEHCWSNAECAPDDYCLFDTCAAETGICQDRPEGCFDIWDPVCGCDGQTYSNGCYAAMAGVTVDYEGECLPEYCWGNDDCDPDEYCLFDGCAAETGICQDRPEGCFDIWDPVCGCDGQTYSNGCYAAMAGVTVDYEGECLPEYCWGNDDCDPDDYCLFDGCAAETGICQDRPEGCFDIWLPVCGCDGQTYSNGCYAARAGVTVDYEGECLTEHCWGNDDCDRDEYCLFDGCAAETGICQDRPEGCFDIWLPVCGCDGQTYSNGCYAARAGVTVDYEGECLPDYCWGNDDCGPDDYCFFDECAAETGICQDRPEACYTLWAPVCGCDGHTYSNACFAAMAGVSVDYTGVCESPCFDNDDCAPGQYCATRPGQCGGPGVCMDPLPDIIQCLDVWKPVCGCDGQTYSNPCYATRAGVSIDYDGVCVSTGISERID